MKRKEHTEQSPKKILAVSDMHGFVETFFKAIVANKPDIVAIAGDISPCIVGIDHERWFRNVFFPRVANMPCKFVATPGNHDLWLQELGSVYANTNVCPKNFHLLADEKIEIDGLRFYGTPWVPWMRGRWAYEMEDSDLPVYFKSIPDDVDVLLAHTPPYLDYSAIDIVQEGEKRRGGHLGSSALTNAIRKRIPRVLFCGHIHTGDHHQTVIPSLGGTRQTLAYNVSLLNEKYEVAYKPLLFSMSKEEFRQLRLK